MKTRFSDLDEGLNPAIKGLIDSMISGKIQRKTIRVKDEVGFNRFLKDAEPAIKSGELIVKQNPIDPSEVWISLGPKSQEKIHEMKHIKLFEDFLNERAHDPEEYLSSKIFDKQPAFKKLYPIWFEETGISDGMPLKLDGKKTSNYGFFAPKDRPGRYPSSTDGLWMSWWDIKSKDYAANFRGTGSGQVMDENGELTVLGEIVKKSK